MIKNEKRISDSLTRVASLMEPGQANLAGNVHGGEIMRMMDNTAGIVARKHSRCSVVTARVDQLQFHKPIHIGNLVTCEGRLTFVGKRSMEVEVRVFVDDFEEDTDTRLALTSLFTMVAMDDGGRPTAVPGLKLESEKERERYEKGRLRYVRYKEERQQSAGE